MTRSYWPRGSPSISKLLDSSDRSAGEQRPFLERGQVSLSLQTVLIQNILPDVEGPLMARLVHNRTELRRILVHSVVKDFLCPLCHIFLENWSPPPSSLSDTCLPPRRLSVIVLTSATLEEARIPLRPASYIMVLIDPTSQPSILWPQATL
jgi:hypothetical protein